MITKQDTISNLKKIYECKTGIKKLDGLNWIFRTSSFRMAFFYKDTNVPCINLEKGLLGERVVVQLGLIYFPYIKIEEFSQNSLDKKYLYKVQLRYPSPQAPDIPFLPSTFIRDLISY